MPDAFFKDVRRIVIMCVIASLMVVLLLALSFIRR